MSGPTSWSQLGINIVGTAAGLSFFAAWVGYGIPFMMHGPKVFNKPKRKATWQSDDVIITSCYGPNNSDHKVTVTLIDESGRQKLMVAHGNSGLIEDQVENRNIFAKFKVENQ